jgi:hypothetical protein
MIDDDDDDDGFDYGEAHARSTDPWTSHAAAGETDAAACEKLVWISLWETGADMTTYDLSEYTGKAEGSITPRMKPLRKKGLVIKVGTVIGPRGAKMTLYRAVRSSPYPRAVEVKSLNPIPGSSGVASPLA